MERVGRWNGRVKTRLQRNRQSARQSRRRGCVRRLVYGHFCGRPDILSRTLLRGVTEVVPTLFREGAQSLYDCRIFLGEIVRLADVIFEVEKLEADMPPDHPAGLAT